jgi:hypothetical protein
MPSRIVTYCPPLQAAAEEAAEAQAFFARMLPPRPSSLVDG